MESVRRENGDGRELALEDLPAEVLDHIFMWLSPRELLTVARVCRLLYDIVKGNQSLHRDVYLLQMDRPEDMDLDWEAEIHKIVRLEHIFNPRRDPEKESHLLPFVSSAVDQLLKHASLINNSTEDEPVSNNVEFLRNLFENELAANVFMQQSSLFERMKTTGWFSVRNPQQHKEEHQMSAKLHCLFGRPLMKAGRTRSTRSYPYACSKVYDLRQYTARTKWGPFRDDDTGRVDWEKVEAINIVLAKNVNSQWPQTDCFDEIWDTPFFGSFSNSFVPRSLPELGDLDARDPYGVTGSWYRIVCFLDYSDFFHYNFSMDGLILHNIPRPPLNVGEATRLIIMNIKVSSIEPPGPDDGQALPVVHYEGQSRALDNLNVDDAHSGIRGTVMLTKEGEVRWTSVSVFNGQERWRSEGIQVGGPRSARGVVGTWFDRDYDIHGPAGPTAFWKAADSKNPREALLAGVRGIVVDPTVPLGLVDSGDELEYMEDDDDDDDEWGADLEDMASELPGLLQDAEMDLAEIAPNAQHS